MSQATINSRVIKTKLIRKTFHSDGFSFLKVHPQQLLNSHLDFR
jgi:hypothetical protein